MKIESFNNVVWHDASVTPARREQLNGHRGVAVWFTGLSGSGKSTIAHLVEEQLHQRGCRTYTLDGDNVRHGLCSDLGFSEKDRAENIRRIAEMVKLFLDAGIIALTAFISPLREHRELVRRLVGPDCFVEVYCACPLEICEQRDVKGLYRRARAGEIKEFTGISAPYEAPLEPDLEVHTHRMPIEECAEQVVRRLRERGVIECGRQRV
jgi:adenylylsulfate kinase